MMQHTTYTSSELALPRDSNGDIDVSAWAKDNLDQDMLTETVRDLKAQQEQLQKDFVQYTTEWDIDTTILLRAEGYEFYISAPCVHMTAKKYAPDSVGRTKSGPPTLVINLPFHAWMVNAAIGFWKTQLLVVPSHDSVEIASGNTELPKFKDQTSLLRLARMVNVAIYTQDAVMLETIYATMRSILISRSYHDEDFLDAIKFVWCNRPVSWERYDTVRKILLTELLRIRERVCGGLEKYFQHIVEESGGERGAFMQAFNLGQVWWEVNELDSK